MDMREKLVELKPCPFCGAVEVFNGKTDRIALTESNSGCWQVICYECLTTSNWYSTQKQAIRAWNRRTEDGK